MKNTIFTLQAYRGIASFLVVLFHSADIIRLRFNHSILNDSFLFGYAGVPLFFVLSGFIICFAHARDVSKPSQAKRYIIKRFVRIYPVYWVLLLAMLPNYFSALKQVNAFHVIENITLLKLTNFDRIIDVSWTLSYEILFYIVFLSFIINRKLGMVATSFWLWLIVYRLVSGQFLLPPYFISHYSGLDYGLLSNLFRLAGDPINVLFIFGAAAYGIYTILLKHPRRELFGLQALSIGAAMFLSVAVIYTNYSYSFMDWRSYYLLYGFASLFLMLAAASRHIEVLCSKNRFLLLLGNASYSIYILHLVVVEIIVGRMDTIPTIGAGWLFLLLVIVSTMAGLLFYMVVEKPLLGFFSRRISPRPVAVPG